MPTRKTAERIGVYVRECVAYLGLMLQATSVISCIDAWVCLCVCAFVCTYYWRCVYACVVCIRMRICVYLHVFLRVSVPVMVGCLRWWNVVHPETPLGFFLNWRVKKTAKQAIFANFHDINTYDTCIGRAFHWYTKNMCTHCCEFHCIHRNLRRVKVSETSLWYLCSIHLPFFSAYTSLPAQSHQYVARPQDQTQITNNSQSAASSHRLTLSFSRQRRRQRDPALTRAKDLPRGEEWAGSGPQTNGSTPTDVRVENGMPVENVAGCETSIRAGNMSLCPALLALPTPLTSTFNASHTLGTQALYDTVHSHSTTRGDLTYCEGGLGVEEVLMFWVPTHRRHAQILIQSLDGEPLSQSPRTPHTPMHTCFLTPLPTCFRSVNIFLAFFLFLSYRPFLWSPPPTFLILSPFLCKTHTHYSNTHRQFHKGFERREVLQIESGSCQRCIGCYQKHDVAPLCTVSGYVLFFFPLQEWI